jgi:hypothetical protein
LSEYGIEPAPERKRQYSWATFIKAHLGMIAGMDFFTVEVVTALGLVRYHVLFVIDIGSRIVDERRPAPSVSMRSAFCWPLVGRSDGLRRLRTVQDGF